MKWLSLGPLGDVYLHRRGELLRDLAGMIWREFVRPVKQRMQYFMEMKFRSELLVEDALAIDEQALRAKALFQ